MAFQSTVYLVSGAGVPGEQFNDYPSRALPYTLVSASAAYNVMGTMFGTVTSQGIAQAGSGGAGGAAGLLVNPKVYALFGAIGSPSLVLPNQTAVEMATEGSYWVTLPAAAAIGDYVVYDNTTGAISTVTPGTSLASGTSWANAYVDVYTVSGAGLGVITLNGNKARTTF